MVTGFTISFFGGTCNSVLSLLILVCATKWEQKTSGNTLCFEEIEKSKNNCALLNKWSKG